jgi:DNA-binding FrmR family transcriptional regulator
VGGWSPRTGYQIPLGSIVRIVTGYVKDKQQIETRLNRIEGQVRGLRKMVDEDRYCIDVLTQVSAVQSALESVALLLLRDHTEHCVAEAIRSGDGSDKVRELSEAVERLVRR